MIELAVMIEGQDGLTWPRWQRLAEATEHLGFAGLYRSDHYTNASPPDKASLELWTSLTWLAGNTQRIEFGPLVSPVSFRHPTMTARMAAAVDDLSGGRLTLGLGAGWMAREHDMFGWELLDIPGRFARFEEGLEVVSRLLQSDTPVDFSGDFYQLREAILLPRPQRSGGPPILIGGNGPKRTLPLVARYAAEWNAVFLPLGDYAERKARLDRLLEAEGRQPEAVRRSYMTRCIFGRDEADVADKAARAGKTVEEFRAEGRALIGTANELVERLGEMAELGIQRVMLQWIEQDDLDGLEGLAKSVLPQVS